MPSAQSKASTRVPRAGHFSLLAQREVTKRNAPPTPRLALRARCPALLGCAGPSRQHIPVLTLGDRDPSRSLFEFPRRSLRCSARRRGVKIKSQTHQNSANLLPLARTTRAIGAPAMRRGCGEKARRVGAMERAQFDVSTWTCCQRTPQQLCELVGQDARRAHRRGVLSLGYLSLHKQRKVTRSAEGRAKALLKHTNSRHLMLQPHRRRHAATRLLLPRLGRAGGVAEYRARPRHRLEVACTQAADLGPKFP